MRLELLIKYFSCQTGFRRSGGSGSQAGSVGLFAHVPEHAQEQRPSEADHLPSRSSILGYQGIGFAALYSLFLFC